MNIKLKTLTNYIKNTNDSDLINEFNRVRGTNKVSMDFNEYCKWILSKNISDKLYNKIVEWKFKVQDFIIQNNVKYIQWIS